MAPHESWFGAAAILAGVAAVALAAVIWILAVYGDRPLRVARAPARAPARPHASERVEREAAMLAEGLSGLREHRVALEALAGSLAAWMTSALWAWLVLLAFQPSPGFGAAGLLVTCVIGLSMIIPSPPAAVGVFEAAGVLALHAYVVAVLGAPVRDRSARLELRAARRDRRADAPCRGAPARPGEEGTRPILEPSPVRERPACRRWSSTA